MKKKKRLRLRLSWRLKPAAILMVRCIIFFTILAYNQWLCFTFLNFLDAELIAIIPALQWGKLIYCVSAPINNPYLNRQVIMKLCTCSFPLIVAGSVFFS